ncbi:hypothetical protein SLNWT_7201 [Streptomyces albus]|uniref:Uncharacterized protein n=1 Tax=Streptomyces albus (strain ATCC 21838 / DSM 41398 / FERM P-419 / JCM 4703 / NBRC 107858) TaxID=1081613 RepID=A0A0B5FAT1_STRA4|nr:hypothetical protein SLNWT_7201 [Streptomyces albus]AOU81879.1 hypothetical protein SLNHY_7188 [Streptomyces albus]AYN37565.1 hypothetical protein DUI70_7072 [Streptomyces albus]
MASASSIVRAAWVPDDDPARDGEIAADLAVKWVRQECVEQSAVGVLVLNTLNDVERQIPSLRRFAAEHAVTTPRASRDRIALGQGPVLAYVPDEKTFGFAASLARGSSLAVVESVHGFPLEGWARQLGAIDFTRPDEQPEPLDAKLAEAINQLDLYKNNGFGDQFGKQQARRILQNLRGAGLLERDVILGVLAAKGASDRAVRNLRKLIDAVCHR